MCTVTYLPLGNNDFILTSNRDENPLRKTIPPASYKENGVELLYPKDELAGGTWIGLSEKKRLVCLLNGGFEKHQRNEYYKMSRGVIVKSMLKSDDFIDFVKKYDFMEIEPFTIVLVDWNNELETYELVWDGTEKYFTKLSQEAKIWSSSTLYTEEMKGLRRNWFADWLDNNRKFCQAEILEFHQSTDLGTQETSIKMKRPFIETVSVTSIKKENKKIGITYLDFVNNKELNIAQKK